MRLYLDDDSCARVLVVSLRQAGHDVQIPSDAGRHGNDDSVHLLHAIREQRVFLSHNHDDFEDLHNLVIHSGGFHPGILIVRRDAGHRRNMNAMKIVRAIANLTATLSSVKGQFIVLNHWQ